MLYCFMDLYLKSLHHKKSHVVKIMSQSKYYGLLWFLFSNVEVSYWLWMFEASDSLTDILK